MPDKVKISATTKSPSGVTFTNSASGPNTRTPQYTLKHDGDYLFVIHISRVSAMANSEAAQPFQAEVELEMKGN